MYPVLFVIPLFGGFPIYTYGVLAAAGFLTGMFWAGREARRVGEDPALAVDLAFWIIVGAIVGSRIAYILEKDWAQFLSDPLMIIRIWEGGLIFHGGMIGALVCSIWFSRLHKKSFLRFADIYAPGIALGHVFGRLGCFFVGCCFGRPLAHDAWYGLTFPAHPHTVAPAGVALYPTQLMEAGGTLLIFCILFVVRKWMPYRGQVFATYLFLYGIVRVVNETFRGDASREYILGTTLSTAQAMGIVASLLGLTLWIVQQRRRAT